MYNPEFTYTQTIMKELKSIERWKAIVELMPIPAHSERDLKEQAKLKMTHYSRRIEGNTLDLEEEAHVVKQKTKTHESLLRRKFETIGRLFHFYLWKKDIIDICKWACHLVLRWSSTSARFGILD